MSKTEKFNTACRKSLNRSLSFDAVFTGRNGNVRSDFWRTKQEVTDEKNYPCSSEWHSKWWKYPSCPAYRTTMKNDASFVFSSVSREKQTRTLVHSHQGESFFPGLSVPEAERSVTKWKRKRSEESKWVDGDRQRAP